jgi:hypothetical protein
MSILGCVFVWVFMGFASFVIFYNQHAYMNIRSINRIKKKHIEFETIPFHILFCSIMILSCIFSSIYGPFSFLHSFAVKIAKDKHMLEEINDQ